ncbi:hypothetical protein FQS60_24535 [Escherichia coli]|nr:hypothetical protein [Escherichia coli]EFB3463867.1 hypothetical protein [Escherichia coli]
MFDRYYRLISLALAQAVAMLRKYAVRDELSLLYVAATRARKTLVLNSVLCQILANSRFTG